MEESITPSDDGGWGGGRGEEGIGRTTCWKWYNYGNANTLRVIIPVGKNQGVQHSSFEHHKRGNCCHTFSLTPNRLTLIGHSIIVCPVHLKYPTLTQLLHTVIVQLKKQRVSYRVDRQQPEFPPPTKKLQPSIYRKCVHIRQSDNSKCRFSFIRSHQRTQWPSFKLAVNLEVGEVFLFVLCMWVCKQVFMLPNCTSHSLSNTTATST